VRFSKRQLSIKKNNVVIQNDVATKPTVVLIRCPTETEKKTVAVVSKQIREEVSKFNFKTKSDIVSSKFKSKSVK
jgi:hypothetical protein